MHRPERASSSTVEHVSYTHGCCWFESSLAHEPDRRRIAQAEERLSDTEEAAGSTPAPPTNTHVTVAQPVERPPETRGVAGSSPAGHIIGRGSVAQTAELPVLTRAVAGSTPAGVTFWKDCHRCGIPSRKRVGFAALGVRLPLLPFRCGRVGKTRGCYPRDRRFDPCRRSSQAPPAPVVETAMTPGPQPGSCGFKSRRGCSTNWL